MIKGIFIIESEVKPLESNNPPSGPQKKTQKTIKQKEPSVPSFKKEEQKEDETIAPIKQGKFIYTKNVSIEEAPNPSLNVQQALHENLEREKKEKKKLKRKIEWKINYYYVPDVNELPGEDIIQELIMKFQEDIKLSSFNYRRFPYKYYTVPLAREKNRLLLLVYIMDSTESLEIISVGVLDLETLRKNLDDKEKIEEILESNYKYKNKLLDKLENKELLQSEIGTRANQLIDEGKFEEAQEIIKIAKDIPPRLISLYKRAMEELKQKDYKKAERTLNEVLELCEKIKDKDLSQYIRLRIQRTREIPNNQKELKSLINTLTKTLNKQITLPPYEQHVNTVRRIMQLFEKLEKDTALERTMELDSLIMKINKVARELRELDKQIKHLLSDIKN